jgi:hypothetical protein
MLKRKEVENYLLDYEILAKLHPELTKETYDTHVSDIVSDDLKPKIALLKEAVGKIQTPKRQFLLDLAKAITPDTETYKELAGLLNNQNV